MLSGEDKEFGFFRHKEHSVSILLFYYIQFPSIYSSNVKVVSSELSKLVQITLAKNRGASIEGKTGGIYTEYYLWMLIWNLCGKRLVTIFLLYCFIPFSSTF